MKYRIVFVTSVILMLVAILLSHVHAHSGKTDSDGGHYDRSTGEYHYHHGYSAHQHYDGECPYDFNDKTNHESSNSTDYNGSSNKSSKNKKDTSTFNDIILRIVFCIFLFIPIYMLVSIFFAIPFYFFENSLDKLSDNTTKILEIALTILRIIITIVLLIFIN